MNTAVGLLQQIEIATMTWTIGTTVGVSMAYVLFISLSALFTILQ